MKNKKIINFGIFTIALLFLGVSNTFASSVLLSPGESVFTPGQSFSLAISVDPDSSKVYTAKIALKYPPEILEVESFTFSSGWQSLTQSGYDLVDNNGGSLIKTAGYTGGSSNKATFGVVTFRVKKLGIAKVTLASNSALYDENSKNVLSGSATSVFTVSAPVVEPEIKRLPAETKSVVTSKSATVEVGSVVTEDSDQVVSGKASRLISLSKIFIYREIFLLMFVIAGSFILGFFVGSRKKKK